MPEKIKSDATVPCEREDVFNLAETFRKIDDKRMTVLLNEHFPFMYKDRETTGTALHVAAMHEMGAPILKDLVARRADVNLCCEALAFGNHIQEMQPIHLAAGKGSVDTIRLLVEHRADVNAKTKHNGQEHYTPLHEAAYHGNLPVMMELIKQGADLELKNRAEQTALHVAAKAGLWETAFELIKGKAQLSSRNFDKYKMSPLDYAVCGTFPNSKLHLLARRCLEDVKRVAERNPRAAKELMRAQAIDDGTIKYESWRSGLLNPANEPKPCWEDFVDLLHKAPSVAADVLELLTVSPKVEDAYIHPLPEVLQRSKRTASLNCRYVTDTEWKKSDVTLHRHPAWHDKLAPGHATFSEKSRRSVHGRVSLNICKICANSVVKFNKQGGRCGVRVRMLWMPNCVNLEVLFALAESQGAIFRSKAAQAIVDYAWNAIVKKQYAVHFALRVLELVVLARVAAAHVETDYERRVLWSFVCATAMRDMHLELNQIWQYAIVLQSLRSYIADRNWIDSIWITIFGSLVVASSGTQELNRQGYRQLLAIVTLTRWFQILYMFRATTLFSLGFKIAPLFESFFKIGAIFLITFVTLVSFCHAFIILDADPLNMGNVLVQTFRVLMLGDGDGVDFVLNLGSSDNNDLFDQQYFMALMLVLGVVVFCVCVLNMFIAVHSAVYEGAQGNAREIFYLSRADICLTSMMMPTWKCRWPRGKHQHWYIPLLVIGLAVWLSSVHFLSDYHPFACAVILVFFLHFGDRLLAQRPWTRGVDGDYSAVEGRSAQVYAADRLPPAKEDRFIWWLEWDEHGKGKDWSSFSGDDDAKEDEEVPLLKEVDDALADAVGEVGRNLDSVKEQVSLLGRRLDALEGIEQRIEAVIRRSLGAPMAGYLEDAPARPVIGAATPPAPLKALPETPTSQALPSEASRAPEPTPEPALLF